MVWRVAYHHGQASGGITCPLAFPLQFRNPAMMRNPSSFGCGRPALLACGAILVLCSAGVPALCVAEVLAERPGSGASLAGLWVAWWAWLVHNMKVVRRFMPMAPRIRNAEDAHLRPETSGEVSRALAQLRGAHHTPRAMPAASAAPSSLA